jgi:benzoate/toluate 1,2-dioxygenase reductase subunit
VTAGEVAYDEYASVSLTQEEMANGEVLTCVAGAATDVTVALPYERGSLITPRPFTLKVERITRLCDSVVQLVAKSAARSAPTFLPGQYVNLRIPGTGHWRSYSMANAPSGDGMSEFLIRILPDGEMSRYLTSHAAVGDTIEAKGPFGTFYHRAGANRVVMIAGGTGVAPMASMLRTLAARQEHREVLLCFGVTRTEDLFYIDELRAAGSQLARFDLRVAVMSGSDHPYVSGTAVDLIAPDDVAGSDFYLCGPPAMTDRAHDALSGMTPSAARIFVERFVPVGETLQAAS